MRKPTIIVLCSGVALGVILRSWQVSESLWLDELHTSWTVGGSLSEVSERAAIGNQSPLYFWIAWFFARLPVPGEIALRLPSMLAGCALPVAVFWLAQKLLPKEQKEPADAAVPLLAALLVAIDPRAIFYSQEARPYALLMLTAVVHIGQLLHALERDDWRPRALWVITGALLVHLHYTGGLILLAEFLALALSAVSAARSPACPTLDTSKRPLRFCFSCWIDSGALLLLLLPAIPGILAVTARRENWNSFVKPQPALEMLRVFPWTPAIFVLIVLHSWRMVMSQRNLVLLSGWLLVPLGLAWVTTQLDIAALFHQRYLIAALPASLLAAALCMRLGPNTATQSILIGIILAIAVASSGIVQNLLHERKVLVDRREDWRAAIAALDKQLDHSNPEPVLVRSGLIEADALAGNSEPLFREYCLCPVKGMYRLDPQFVMPLPTSNPGKLPPQLSDRLRGEERLWLLVRTSQASVRDQLLRDLKHSLQVAEFEAEKPQFFGNLYLQRIRLHKLPRSAR